MRKPSLYSVHAAGNTYRVLKYDLLGEEAVYNVTAQGCDCPASYHSHTPCRHIKMVDLFKANDLVDSDYRYSYDTNQWKEPNAKHE